MLSSELLTFKARPLVLPEIYPRLSARSIMSEAKGAPNLRLQTPKGLRASQRRSLALEKGLRAGWSERQPGPFEGKGSC